MARGRARALLDTSLLALGIVISTSPAAAQETAQQAPAPGQDQAASAVPAGSGAGGGVEEIVVTAQFREQNLQKTPLAITAVSGDMLRERSQTNIADITNQAPNVTLKPQAAAYGPSLIASSRGVGQFDFNPALEPGVGIYVDDVYYATLTGSLLDLLDLDRVEVLRGPQGTLAGRNSIGGAIKLYSKKPTGSGNGYVSATYGSRNRIDLRGGVDLPVAENLYARVAGVAKNQNGYITRLDYGCVFPDSGIPAQARSTGNDCVLGKNGDVNYIAGRAQLRYAPSDTFEINIIGDYTRDVHNTAGSVLVAANYTGPADVNPFGPGIAYDSRFVPPRGSYYNYATFDNPADGPAGAYQEEDKSDFRGWGLSAQVDWKLADRMQLVSITSYRTYDLLFTNDDDYSPLSLNLGYSHLDFWSFSQELRLSGSVGADDLIEYTLGGYYSDQRSIYRALQDVRYAGLPIFFGNDPVPADSLAGFAHATLHATDQLSLTGGLRYTKESKKYTFVRRDLNGNPHPVLGGLDGLTGSYSGNRVDYRANVQYEWSPRFMTYAQVSTGFKGGGINPRPFNDLQVLPFDPETLTSYEVGLKSDLFDRKMRLNVAVFYSRYKDIQLQLNSCPTISPDPCGLYTNAGSANMKGFEVETSIRPTRGLIIDGAFSYLDFDYKSVSPLATGLTLDMVPPYVPKWKWSLGAQYEIPIGEYGTVTPRIDVSYQSDIYDSAVNAPTGLLPGYTLANARVTWRHPEDWELSLEVINLFDKYYFLSGLDQVGLGAGYSSAQPGRPREWALSIRKNF